MVDSYSGQAYRLLALAGRRMLSVKDVDFAGMTQQQVEAKAGPLDLLGLLVLSNHLRPDSKHSISVLRTM